MASKIAIFRADASPVIGGGHVARCLSLADALAAEGWVCRFVVGPDSLRTVPDLARYAVTVLAPHQLTDPQAVRTLFPGGCALAVVDHYQLDAVYESGLKGWAERILVIDDLANRNHDCDALLDPTLGATQALYAGRVPSACQMLLGADYALLKSRFFRLRPAALARRDKAGGKLRRVLVTMGATDPVNATLPVLQALAALDQAIQIDVVMGGAAPYLSQVQDYVARHADRISLHVQTDQMAELMAGADLAVGAGGGASWERCCLGLPSLSLVVADNQRFVAQALQSAGASLIVTLENVAAEVERLASDAAVLVAMGNRAALLCDGLGASRAVTHLFAVPDRSGSPVTLRRATQADGEVMLEWQSHPVTRAFARNSQIPTREEHFAWLDRKLNSPQTLLCMIEADGQSVGVTRLDPPDADGLREVSIYLSPSVHGVGIASAALRQLRRLDRCSTFKATVLEGNEASLKLFVGAGYRRRADGWFILAAPEEGTA